MEELREKLESIRFANTNWEGRYFIPDDDLLNIVSESAVKISLRSLAVPLHEITDLTDGILQGARRCFAILVFIRHGEAISGFFRHDSLRSHPDDRLPYTSEALQQIFEKDEASSVVRNFLEKQWEFFIPIMHQHSIDRILDKRTILPFLHEESVGEGAMGVVSKVKLHPQCHRLPLQNHEVARKQIRHGEKRVSDFQQELRNLALLTHLKHPNIVQLYCAYQYRQEYNLIFAVADGGSLADLLNGKRDRPEELHFPLALAGLADAVDAMHNFRSEALDVSLSGCHHDLAPRNVLIHGKTFLLADLGLSSFQHTEDSSSTAFIGVDDFYVAPEFQTFRDGHVQARRASDIWSFGCIIAEVLTYMVKGSGGVKKFCDKRQFEWVPGTWWNRFHRGPTTPSPEVTTWLSELQANGEPYRVRMVGVIQKMLSLDPKERPRSAQVKKSLRGISILSLAKPVGHDLETAYKDDQCIDLLLGNKRFRSWLSAFNQLLDAIDQTKPSDLNFDFPKTVQALEDMRRILEGSGERASDTKYVKYSLLRYQYARLVEALPPTYRSIAKDYLVNSVLREDDAEQLDRLSAAITDIDDKDIGTLLAVKHLTALAETGDLIEQTELVLNQRDITLGDPVDIHHLASLAPSSEHILVEWLRYKESWADNATRTQLRRRLTTVANLLHNNSTTQIPGSLRCRGIFHDVSQPALGFVYDIPTGTQPVTLHRLLEAENPCYPLLENRFRLAFDICQCIYMFHKVGWLHRNLHSINVLFFPPKGAEKAEWAKEPRILGFTGSRENQLDSHTHGPDLDSELQSYQHPEYFTHHARYREEFDYYSVGMILLEIGLWKTLSRITKSNRFKRINDEEFRREVLKSRVPQLGISMGTRYMEATRICLEGDFAGTSADADGGDNWSMAFKSLVMDRIPLME
ncbi:kinase-like domain-containing protein [Rhypophila decipiens]|uniref:Kinase-like domain-containing protein n=1 Tax=Rhypophila decipiens TaxID=261697 RepID=A0AAN7B2P5_9PEZI|nr:kinase-like domain-containing protein [Rhypophila decipiens]